MNIIFVMNHIVHNKTDVTVHIMRNAARNAARNATRKSKWRPNNSNMCR
jgi:hypothetical protein